MAVPHDTRALQLCARLLELTRPLVVLDLETTGLDRTQDAVLQVGLARVEPDGDVTLLERLVDPGRPVPRAVQELTGITDALLEGAPPFREVAAQINDFVRDADLAGYNIARFDVPFLEAVFEREGLVLEGPPDRQLLDACQIFRQQEAHSLERAVAFYTGRPLVQSHRALDDVLATADVLAAQLTRYKLAGALNHVIAAVRYPYLDGDGKLKEVDGRMVLCFGKYRDRAVEEVLETDPRYLDWVVGEIGGEVGRFIAERVRRLKGAISGRDRHSFSGELYVWTEGDGDADRDADFGGGAADRPLRQEEPPRRAPDDREGPQVQGDLFG